MNYIDTATPVNNHVGPQKVYDANTDSGDGTALLLGELEDHGPGDIRAWLGAGDGREAIGSYPDIKTAMSAICFAFELNIGL